MSRMGIDWMLSGGWVSRKVILFSVGGGGRKEKKNATADRVPFSFVSFGTGIMRCCAYSASVNRALYIPLGGAGQNETAIQHFEDKLFKISGNAMKVSFSAFPSLFR